MLPDRLLLTAEGDAGGDPPIGGGGAPTPPAPAPAPAAGGNGTEPSWYAPAETLKTSDPEVWSSFEKGVQSGNHKDFPTFIKHAVGLEKKLGTSLTLPDKANADQVKDFKSKLVKGGVDLKALASEAPESPDKYDIKLDSIPEAMRSEPTVTALRGWAHKHGLSNEAVAELVGIEMQRYETTVKPALAYTAEENRKAIEDFAESVGKEPNVIEAYSGAWLTKNFTENDIKFLESVKIPGPDGKERSLADHPVLLKFAARAGLDTGEDISVIDGMGTAVDNEYEDMMKNLGDTNHPDYKLFHAKGVDPQDPKRQAFMAKREAILRRKFPGEAAG